MSVNQVSTYSILSAVICLSCSTSSFAQTDEIYDSFEKYQFEKIVSDTENRLKAESENQKLITDLKLLDTLLLLNNETQIILLQKFGFFKDVIIRENNQYDLIFNSEQQDVYESLVKARQLKQLQQFVKDDQVSIKVITLSQMQISALPQIINIPRNKEYDKAVASLYFNAIKDRIPQSADLVARGFTIIEYTKMEQRSLINTYQKMIKFRAAFLNFLFTKYNPNDR